MVVQFQFKNYCIFYYYKMRPLHGISINMVNFSFNISELRILQSLRSLRMSQKVILTLSKAKGKNPL